ncbi:Cytochrome c, mono-and diheme variants [Cupriavidus sp. YR651]|uniref:c-type cytochrome n=1 Tax=Cupriavidus sp. YR651 TaxID=1855315 RepID=UPI0008828AA4|nr:cytochrome c [Cupriavidus sp. YR651]SDC10581.1 Cytochrome c, mono-and diheme variants [Cupriavidus sp. YR651]
MNGLPPQAWLNTLLVVLQEAQLALLRAWHALGLTGDIHGQPAWPWAHRIVGETLLIDLGLARQLAWSVAAITFALLAVMVALLWRRRRLPWLAAGALALVLAPWPSPALVFGPAAPTSFHASPTGFSVASIARGERVYTQHCAACHGADGRGEGPLAHTLQHWPPTVVSPLLGRRAEGELFWHIQTGMRDVRGRSTMPAFGRLLDDADTWAVLDYMKALAAGSGAVATGNWPNPLRLPDVSIRCGTDAPRPLSEWRGNQRVRVVAFDGPPAALPIEDPRFLTLLVTPDGKPPASVPQFRAGCVAMPAATWRVIAQIAGVPASALAGTELLADRNGWLRARGAPGRGTWSDADLLCTSGQPAAARAGTPPSRDGLTALLLRMDAEPVRFVQGGFIH